ncbi:MAG: 2-C-methyl-D-erythritol 4-phosphate cytidylyltransferase [Xanthomonadales bacterium]|nr:2-C-methyl-D-erythritol 4-phosphate cytidylyltransferase [Xanthomonadales bacterium]
MTQHVRALVPAAGQSIRFGGATPKQYMQLLGKPVLAHSIAAVREHPAVQAVTVVLAQNDSFYDGLVGPLFPEVSTTTGGDSRARSVLNGLRYIRSIDARCEWVLVHDAARPCLAASSLAELMLLGLASEHGAILAVPVSDTLKREQAHQRIDRTVDRSGLWSAQTPQLFPLDALLRNLQAVIDSGVQPTDEAEAMERAGFHPLLVRGSSSNVKITCADDLPMAELILRRRQISNTIPPTRRH